MEEKENKISVTDFDKANPIIEKSSHQLQQITVNFIFSSPQKRPFLQGMATMITEMSGRDNRLVLISMILCSHLLVVLPHNIKPLSAHNQRQNG